MMNHSRVTPIPRVPFKQPQQKARHSVAMAGILLMGCRAETGGLASPPDKVVDSGEFFDGAATDAGPAPCADSWSAWRGSSGESGATGFPVDFVLADDERLFLNVEQANARDRAVVERVDLSTGMRRLFLSETLGSVYALDAKGDALLLHRTARSVVGEQRIDYVTGSTERPMFGMTGETILPGARYWIGSQFAAVHLVRGPEQIVVVRRGNEASFGWNGLRHVQVSGSILAGRRIEHDAPGENRIQVHVLGQQYTPVFSRDVGNAPAADVETGPWVFGDGALWVEDGQILRWQLGTSDPTPLTHERGCMVLDSKGTTAVIGCEPVAAVPVPLYAALHVVVGSVTHEVKGVDGWVSEAAVLSRGRVAWRQWRDADGLCRTTVGETGDIVVEDVLSDQPAERVGGALVSCLCCAGAPPLRLEAEGNSVAWNYDATPAQVAGVGPPIAASFDTCRRGRPY